MTLTEGRLGDVREGSVAEIAIQDVGVIEPRDIQIHPAVKVKVRGGRAAGHQGLPVCMGRQRVIRVVDAGA